MHVGKQYPFANNIRVISIGAFEWPELPSKRYEFTAPHWVDQLGIHPHTGTFRTDVVVYNPGQRFATWDVAIPCDAGHSVVVRLRLDQPLGTIASLPSGIVIVDGTQRGNSVGVNTADGSFIDWFNWSGAIGSTVAPQNSGSQFPSHVATTWP